MPPRGHSRSSHSSRSNSRSHSSSSYSSRSHSSSSRYNPNILARKRTNQPSDIPGYIMKNRIEYRGSKHDYTYYSRGWESNGTEYKAGYYDETGKYYDPSKLVFKYDSEKYSAMLKCEYCGNTVFVSWKENELSSICKQCGASMSVERFTTDTILSVTDENDRRLKSESKSNKILESIIVLGISAFLLFNMFIRLPDYIDRASSKTNVDIYGSELYLDLIDEKNNIYEICTADDTYEKHLTWDYGTECYYDKESDCYIWYNTDVSPNLWQYWYEDISNDYESGWMEFEGVNEWYIEDQSGKWDIYSGDTSDLWHILCEFDK